MQQKNDMLSPELFFPAEDNFSSADEIKRPNISFMSDVWRRLRKNKLAMLGLIIIVVLIVMVIAGPLMTSYNHVYQDYSAMNQLASKEHWFGTDDVGRDLWTRAWMGGRVSLFIGIMAALIDLVLGVIVGGAAGYLGGKVDNILMRLTEILYSIPYMLMVILLSVLLGSGVLPMILALSITGWIPMARLVRGQVLTLKEMEYVQAADTFGAGFGWILRKHLIPNAMGPIIVNITLTIPRAIFSEATLSFLGLGVQPPTPSWGQMASDAVEQMLVGNLNVLLVPSILICLTMFAFNVLGDGLRDAFDPRLRK